jgi:hypothetical protein
MHLILALVPPRLPESGSLQHLYQNANVKL